MEKTLKSAAMLLFGVFSAGIFTGCALEVLSAIGQITAPISEAAYQAGTNKAAAAAGRKATLNERLGGRSRYSPFDNEAEDRLTRRTSSLTEGDSVDITPYLFHEDSFAVVEDKIRYCRSVIDFTGKTEKGFFTTPPVVEFDITVSFEADNRQYQTDLTAVPFGNNGKRRINSERSAMGRYAAGKHGVTGNIKNIKLDFKESREGSNFIYLFENILVQDTEPCYYQFDVEVEYQKTSPFLRKVRTTDFATFNKVYRSDFRTLAAAAIAVQAAIWQDARDSGIKDSPLPVVNFVRVAKMTR